MWSHESVWAAIDQLAARHGLSPSGLAKKAGLDPTAFNPSKRHGSDGRPRAWYRDLDRELLVEEELFLAEKVYNGGHCRHELIRIVYSNRFSDRV